MLSNLLENGEKCIEKYNFCIKYFGKIKCYADRPYLFFSELKPETHIYFFLVLPNNEKFHHSRCSLSFKILSFSLSLSLSLSVCLSLFLSLCVRPVKKEDAKDAIKRDMMRHGIDFDFLNFGTSSLRIFSLFSPIFYSLTLSSHSHFVQLFPFCPFSLCPIIPTLRRDVHLTDIQAICLAQF